MDASLMSAGIGAFGTFMQIDAANTVASIKAGTENTIRDLNNQTTAVVNARNAALTGLQRWTQSVRNDRVMEGLAANQSALATNFNRARDARSRQNFATNVQQAEAAGRTQAAIASSGVTGSVVDMINQATSLKIGMEKVARREAERQINYDFKVAEIQQTYAALDQLDTGLIFDDPQLMDFRQSIAQTSNAGLAALTSFATQGGLSGLGSFFSSAKGASTDTLGAFLTLNDNFSSK